MERLLLNIDVFVKYNFFKLFRTKLNKSLLLFIKILEKDYKRITRDTGEMKF